MNFTDAVEVSGTRRTQDGYLVAEARAVRTGVQQYLGSEVGKPELSLVNVYRPADQVFADTSLQSFTHAPVTLDHPAEPVSAENWKSLAVGEVSTAAKKDGEWVMLPLILKDAAAIQSVETGKRELSAGYTCELVWGDGVLPNGETYQAMQTNIKINHLAIVDKARAGSTARIGDVLPKSWGAGPLTDHNLEREKIMTLKTIAVDGIPVEVTDAAATVISTLQARIADADKAKATAQATYDASLSAKDAELAKKDAEIDALKAKVLDGAALDKRVQERADLVTVAGLIAKDVKTAGVADADIRKAVVVAKLGDAVVAGKAEAYIDARFDILAEEARKGGVDTFAQGVRDGIKLVTTDRQEADKAHAEMTGRFNNFNKA